MIYAKNKIVPFALFGLVFLAFVFLLRFLIDDKPIVGDGYQNLTIAKNIIDHFVFSSSKMSAHAPIPDMLREPAWPFLTAFFLYFLSLDVSPHLLASDYYLYFKYLNLAVYALIASIVCSYTYLKTKQIFFSLIASLLVILIYGTVPRLINNFNNEALATLFLLLASIIFYELINIQNKGGVTAALLGLVLGFLALTKAQFLFISIPLILFLFFIDRNSAVLAITLFVLTVSPWIYRNYVQFNEPAIAKRGVTVAVVRVILTAEPTPEERQCMSYAFIHPLLRHHFEEPLGVNSSDFMRGGKCQRLNREICFDMGTTKVKCAPFPEDLLSEDYSSKIQLFYKGYSAGQLIENKKLSFGDVFKPSADFFIKYIKTFPLFAWRGTGFSDYPIIAIAISISAFILLFTKYWSFSLLSVFSQIFHIALTHNIPRYHSTLYPVLILSFVFLLYWLINYLRSLFATDHA